MNASSWHQEVLCQEYATQYYVSAIGTGLSNVIRRWMNNSMFCNIFITRYFTARYPGYFWHTTSRDIARYLRYLSCGYIADNVVDDFVENIMMLKSRDSTRIVQRRIFLTKDLRIWID